MERNDESETADGRDEVSQMRNETADVRATDVHVSVEMSGSYDEVMARLDGGPRTDREFAEIREKLARVLDTVRESDGDSLSDIRERSGIDGSVHHLLRTLEAEGYVRLDEKTWKPEPKAEPDE